jgi:hypothetical protein
MNCEKFESVVTDMARKQLTEAALREEATLHTRACQRCAARFAQEQNLSVALRALALLDENKKADHEVEANLLNAFRTRTRAVAAPPVASGQQNEGAPRSRQVYWWAAAALIIIALTFFVLRVQNPQPIQQPPQAHDNQAPQKPDNQNPQNNIVKQSDKLIPHENGPVAVNRRNDGSLRKNLLNRPQSLSAKNRHQSNRANRASKPADEIATNFIRLHDLPMTEGGQLVRVTLPRSALATFGLPVNVARADQPVKADVVIGNDGIARAIRFIQ